MSSLFSPRTSVVVLAAALSFAACKRGGEGATADTARATASTESRAPVPAKLEAVQVKMLPQSIELSGTLDADETSEVATQVAGLVKQVNVDVGTRVKKGDPMVVLDPRDASLKAQQAVATQEQAKARLGLDPGQKFDPMLVPDVRAAKEALDIAQLDADRTKQLFDTGTVSQAQWDAARTTLQQRKAQYDAAVAAARTAYATLSAAESATSLAQKQVADSTIRAPFDGSVAEKRVSLGEYANVGKVVAVVVADQVLRLRVDVPEADIGKVKLGSKVDVSVAAFPDRTFEGTVKRIGASLKQQSRTLPVEAEIPNQDGTLRAGLFAKAQLAVPGTDKRATLVPESAIGSTGSSSRVFVFKSGHVVEKLVKAGRRYGDKVEVVGDLAEGDRVAVTNVDKLVDGAEVTEQR